MKENTLVVVIGDIKIVSMVKGTYTLTQGTSHITVNASDLLYLMDFLLQIASKLEKEQKEESDYLPPIPDG